MSEPSYLHGIRVVSSSGEVRAVTLPSQSVVGVVGTAPESLLATETPHVFFRKNVALSKIAGAERSSFTGSLVDALEGIYSKKEVVAVVVIAKSDSHSDIGRAIDQLLIAESATGYKPKILVAPGFTGNIPTEKTPENEPTEEEPLDEENSGEDPEGATHEEEENDGGSDIDPFGEEEL